MDALLKPLIACGRNCLTRGMAAAARYSLAGLFGALAIVTAMAAVGVSLAALWTLLLPYLDSAGSLLVLAGVLVILCLALSLVACAIIRDGRQNAVAERAPQDPLLAAAELFKDNKESLLLAAFSAGLCAGDRGKHR